jgi:hypothetical protein
MVKKGRNPDGAPKEKDKMMLAGQGPGRPAKNKDPAVDQRIQREIGRHLRAQYDDVVNEPVPDRFLELLEQLERSVRKG